MMLHAAPSPTEDTYYLRLADSFVPDEFHELAGSTLDRVAEDVEIVKPAV
jgi:hypothetical protein